MRRTSRLIVALLVHLVTSCAPTTPPAVTSSESDRARVEKGGAEMAKLRARLDALEPKVREACEFRAGDCLMESREKRDELLGGRTFYECRNEPSPAQRERCEEAELVELGEAGPVGEYYQYVRWCLSGMLDCVAELERENASVSRAARYTERKQAIELSARAQELGLELDIALARVKYLRLVLPPSAQTACTALPAVDQCLGEVEAARQAYDTTLQRDEDYDEAAAKAAFELIGTTDVKCVGLEQACVEAEFKNYGGDATALREAVRNYPLIAERERQLRRVPPRLAKKCLDTEVANFQADIVRFYMQYASKPSLYFLIQLHRAFVKLHEAQIDCLKRVKK